MQNKKNEAGNSLPMIVTEGVAVNVLPNEQYEFLMTNKDVSHGYGTSEYVIRQCKSTNPNEFIEGKHFIKGVSISHTQPHQVFWTKRGIVRLGFFIKSERAKLFRDWAEEVILKVDKCLLQQPPIKQLAAKRNHNRLTQDRLLSIMADVCQIDDKDLRLRISSKLMEGGLK